ncbi:uncharacterized protein LOC115891249 [Sitophilus oryzae]|uniref:Uncharacterized protein LOC115891249 n=1 Tax=Sitophilus oryzae TaxID=7048 RepID=A0A6J2YW87_SITOR|nr:uncharacterized protein LOC115891249 [Sitophilus oryzae]
MEIILKSSNRIPKKLVSDNGKEYYNSQFQNLMKKYKIQHYSTFSPLKASIAERVIRTIKEKLFRSFTLNGNHKWLELLNKVTEDYNDTKHRTIGMKPKNVDCNSEKKLLDGVYSHIKVAGKSKILKLAIPLESQKAEHIFEKRIYAKLDH